MLSQTRSEGCRVWTPSPTILNSWSNNRTIFQVVVVQFRSDNKNSFTQIPRSSSVCIIDNEQIATIFIFRTQKKKKKRNYAPVYVRLAAFSVGGFYLNDHRRTAGRPLCALNAKSRSVRARRETFVGINAQSPRSRNRLNWRARQGRRWKRRKQ